MYHCVIVKEYEVTNSSVHRRKEGLQLKVFLLNEPWRYIYVVIDQGANRLYWNQYQFHQKQNQNQFNQTYKTASFCAAIAHRVTWCLREINQVKSRVFKTTSQNQPSIVNYTKR